MATRKQTAKEMKQEQDPFVRLAKQEALSSTEEGRESLKGLSQELPNAFRLTLTARTIARLQSLREKEQDADLTLRVRVHAGGCSGYKTEFSLDKEKTAQDLEIEQDGVRVLIDRLSAQTLGASRLDFESAPIGQQFRLFAEKAHSACGCGVSFAL